MAIGKNIRLKRVFSHQSGRFFSTAFDHFIGYDAGMPDGLRRIKSTIENLVEAAPDAMTIHKGVAESVWGPYAGTTPLIIQSVIARLDIPTGIQITSVEEALRLGADAYAVSLYVRGAEELEHLRMLSASVKNAAQFDIPVIAHVYPRKHTPEGVPFISTSPEDIAWAVRCCVEVGVDVVKTPYCGTVDSYRQIVDECPVPVVAAGGPKTETILEALIMMENVLKAGAIGATVGRNIWGNTRISEITSAYKAVIHDLQSPLDVVEKFHLTS